MFYLENFPFLNILNHLADSQCALKVTVTELGNKTLNYPPNFLPLKPPVASVGESVNNRAS